MFKTTQCLTLAALLALAAGCAKERASIPAPAAAPASVNYVAPVDPSTGGSGGGGSQPPCNVAPTSTIKGNIRRYVALEAPTRGWTVVTTITPPDGITYGTGCNYVYPFSVDIIIDQTGQSSFAQGTYDSSTNTYTLSL